MKHLLALPLLSVSLLMAPTASAEEPGRVVTLRTTDVVGRVRRPAIVIEVTRARMQLGATTPTLAAVGSNTTPSTTKNPL